MHLATRAIDAEVHHSVILRIQIQKGVDYIVACSQLNPRAQPDDLVKILHTHRLASVGTVQMPNVC